MKLIVIIVTYNAMRWAKRCIDSLKTSTIRPVLYVVDNGSTDGTQIYIKEQYPDIIFFQSEKNIGFGQANNIGIKYALENNFDYIYLLNQDAWVLSDTFEKLIKISEDNPEFGLISPIQMNADLYTIDKNFSNSIFNKQNKNLINDIFNNKLKDIYETMSFIMAAHWFLTKECIQKVGGFSPSFEHYGEDNNFVNRAIYHGFKIGITPHLKVVHDRGDRTVSYERIIYFYYTSFLIALSNPLDDHYLFTFIKKIVYCFKLAIQYRSLKPFSYYLKVVVNFSKIIKNKKISKKKDCAFL